MCVQTRQGFSRTAHCSRWGLPIVRVVRQWPAGATLVATPGEWICVRAVRVTRGRLSASLRRVRFCRAADRCSRRDTAVRFASLVSDGQPSISLIRFSETDVNRGHPLPDLWPLPSNVTDIGSRWNKISVGQRSFIVQTHRHRHYMWTTKMVENFHCGRLTCPCQQLSLQNIQRKLPRQSVNLRLAIFLC